MHPEGRVDVVIGTVSQGQGHETSFAQLVTDFLGVPLDKVDILAGDTAIVKVGGGAHSGRGMRLGSIVIWNASNKIIEKGKRIAARLLDCEPSGVRFERAVSDKGDRRQSDPVLNRHQLSVAIDREILCRVDLE